MKGVIPVGPGGMELRCLACIDAVVANTRFLYDGGWVLGEDGKRHWSRVVGESAVGDDVKPIVLSVCGVRVLQIPPRGG